MFLNLNLNQKSLINVISGGHDPRDPLDSRLWLVEEAVEFCKTVVNDDDRRMSGV